MTINEFINLDYTNSLERETILGQYVIFLNELVSKDFPAADILMLGSVADIFLIAIEEKKYLLSEKRVEYKSLITDLIKLVRLRETIQHKSFLIKLLYPKRYNRIRVHHSISDSFQILFSKTVELLNHAKDNRYSFDKLGLDEFYTPDKSNKTKISELIKEAIDLINQDITLTEKSRKKIIDYLKKALNELSKNNPDWTKFLGILKETVIVLAAVATISGNTSILIPKQKVEQALEVVQKTSITYSFKSLIETINIQNAPKLVNFQDILKIEENTGEDQYSETEPDETGNN